MYMKVHNKYICFSADICFIFVCYCPFSEKSKPNYINGMLDVIISNVSFLLVVFYPNFVIQY